jgi:hypothetical protein
MSNTRLTLDSHRDAPLDAAVLPPSEFRERLEGHHHGPKSHSAVPAQVAIRETNHTHRLSATPSDVTDSSDAALPPPISKRPARGYEGGYEASSAVPRAEEIVAGSKSNTVDTEVITREAPRMFSIFTFT